MAIGLASFGLVRITSVQTDSMSPDVNSGSLTVSLRLPTSEVKAGDVISVRTIDGNNEDVLGRVVAIEATETNNIYEYSLKSDNNLLPDEWLYKTTGNSYKLSFSIPVLGYFVQFLKSPIGAFVYILAILGLAITYMRVLHAPVSDENKKKKLELQEKRYSEENDHNGIDDINTLFELVETKGPKEK
jgi:signal peptidase I